MMMMMMMMMMKKKKKKKKKNEEQEEQEERLRLLEVSSVKVSRDHSELGWTKIDVNSYFCVVVVVAAVDRTLRSNHLLTQFTFV